MNAKQCDRCGAFYSDLKFNPEYVCVRTHKRTSYTYRKTLDLCPECSKKLSIWIQEYCEIGVIRK